MSLSTWIAIAGALSPFLALWFIKRDNDRKDAAHAALVDERLSRVPTDIESALAKWQGPFLKELNGTYMRTPLIESHLKGIGDRIEAVQREVRHEIKNAMTPVFLIVGQNSEKIQRLAGIEGRLNDLADESSRARNERMQVIERLSRVERR